MRVWQRVCVTGSDMRWPLIVVSLAVSAFAASPVSKVARELQDIPDEHGTEVIVQFREGAAERLHQKIESRGGALRRHLSLINAGHYSLPASAIRDLASDPDVAFISPDRTVSGSLEYAA